MIRLRGRESPSQEMDLCLMMYASPNAKVHGVLMMLSPMKSGEKFNTITGTFVLPPCEPLSLQSLSTAAVPHTNAQNAIPT